MKNTWVCFHCECAIPVAEVAKGLDDPVKMAAAEWSSPGHFEGKAFKAGLRAFWVREHARAAAEHAKVEEGRRRKLEEEEKQKAKEVGGWVGVRDGVRKWEKQEVCRGARRGAFGVWWRPQRAGRFSWGGGGSRRFVCCFGAP